eukprot:403367555
MAKLRGVLKHDMAKRRTLKRKNELLRTYGVWGLSGCGVLYVMWALHRRMYPKEYQSEEEQEKDQRNFDMVDWFKRVGGYLQAFGNKRENMTQSDIYLPKSGNGLEIKANNFIVESKSDRSDLNK